MIYCQSCDKNIFKKLIKKHNKSKTHLYLYNNFVINKYYIGDILWRDFENTFRDYIKDHNNKFNSFSIKIDFQLNNENMSICVDNIGVKFHYINLKIVDGYIINFVKVEK